MPNSNNKVTTKKEIERKRKILRQKIRRRRFYALLRIIILCILIFGIYKTISFFTHRNVADVPEDTNASAEEMQELPPESNDEEPEQLVEAEPPQEHILSDAEKMEIIKTSPEYPEDLVNFAGKYTQVLDYVYYYPEMKNQTAEIDLSAEAASEIPPLLIQWDSRWGYAPYGDGLIGYNGCGPVCLSMAALYLTGNPQYTPITVAKMAEENGYCVPGNGSSWTLISEGCQNVGLNAKELPLGESIMKQELDQNHPIIIVVGPGDFTYSGHYMMITGYTDDGFILNDPNSRENSARHWSYDAISNQIRNLWAMSAA